MIWLGDKRGQLSDWLTQRWVQATGRRVTLEQNPWLDGPIGATHGIGQSFFDDLAREEGLVLYRGPRTRGLISDFSSLASPTFDPAKVMPQVVAFYERTSEYDIDAWAEWCGIFRPFGRMLAFLFSRRLQQLNVPLSGLETSRGMTSDVAQLVEPKTNIVLYTAWVRTLLETGNVIYAGSYATCTVPGYAGRCVKVVFPLPNGNAIVIMKPTAHSDGSVSIASSGNAFGDPGFYFTVHGADGKVWARYVRTMRESIRVYAGERQEIRADHVLRIWGTVFLRLHYKLLVRGKRAISAAT